MSETLHSVVQQLEAERARLGQLLEQKQAEALGLKVEVDRVQDALTALTSTSRQTAPSKPSATRTDLLAIVHEVLASRPSGVPVTELKEAVKRSLKRTDRSARGLHKALPHVLAHNSLRVEGETVILRT